MTLFHKRSYVKAVIYLYFSVVIFCMHLPMEYIHDDLTVLPSVQTGGLWDFFVQRFYSNGKIFTDVLANFFYRFPMLFWKVFDTAVFLLIAVLIIKTFTKDTWQDAFIVCVLFSLFPFWYLSTAGYIATATNYLYPMACLLVVLFLVKRLYEGHFLRLPGYILAFISILYAANQDQAGVMMIGGLLLVVLYGWKTGVNKQVMIPVGVLLVFAVISYLFLFFLPGHINRMQSTVEMEYWLPEYAHWSFFKKIYRAYTSTVAAVFFHDVKLFDVFCLLLLVTACCLGKPHQKVIGAIPFLTVLSAHLIGYEQFVVYPSYAGGMPELADIYGSLKGIAVLLLTVISVACIFYTVITCVQERERKCQMLLFLVLGAGSRMMMGFSATLYASHARTFTYLVFALFFCSVILLDLLRRSFVFHAVEKTEEV